MPPQLAGTIDAAPRIQVHDFLAPGLGDRSYVVVAGGSAVAVDPLRDVEQYLDAVEAAGARLTHVLETHVHNDYDVIAVDGGGVEDVLALARGATR